MITEGIASSYVAASSHRPLPSAGRAAQPFVRQRETTRCGRCQTPSRRPGDHICVAPETHTSAPAQCAAIVKQPRTPRRRTPVKARVVREKPVRTCACGTALVTAAAQCHPCAMNAQRALTDDQEAEIARLYVDGVTNGELARRFNVSTPTITLTLRRRGVAIARRGVRVPDATVAEIVAGYTDGESVTALSKRLNVSTKTVYRLLREREATMPVKGRAFADRRILTPEQADAVAAKYRAGSSAIALSREFGISQHSIRATLVRHGVEIRGIAKKAT